MAWTYRKLLFVLILSLTLASIGGLGSFFVRLYSKDKTQSLLTAELSNTRRLASHLGNLVELSGLIEAGRVADSRDIIFLIENPCGEAGAARNTVVSRHYAEQLREIGTEPVYWGNSLEVFRACQELRESPAPGAGLSIRYVPSNAQIMVPYLLALTRSASRTRLSMLSLDGFRSATHNTVFLAERDGSALWSADGKAYLDGAFADTLIDASLLSGIAAEVLQSGESRSASKIRSVGIDGLLSHSAVPGERVLMSLSYAPALLESVWFAVSQMVFLVAGFLLLCLFAGKVMAEKLSVPLEELAAHADRIGGGDFTRRFEERGLAEFARLKGAFNVMSGRIADLIEQTRNQAALEKEIVLAQEVQKMLIPPPQLELTDHRISGVMRPAHYVGGDWWGVREIAREGRRPLVLVCVGDATDHGVPPALVAATVKGAHTVLSDLMADRLKKGKDSELDSARLLEAFHRTIWDASHGAISMTMIMAVLDIEAGKLTVANAGHVRPFLLAGAEGSKMIGGAGTGLGVTEDPLSLEVQEHPWKPGDRLVLYSDGLVEHFRDEVNVFDRKALSKALKGMGRLGAREIVNRTLQLLAKEAEGVPQADDITLVACEAKPLAEATHAV